MSPRWSLKGPVEFGRDDAGKPLPWKSGNLFHSKMTDERFILCRYQSKRTLKPPLKGPHCVRILSYRLLRRTTGDDLVGNSRIGKVCDRYHSILLINY